MGAETLRCLGNTPSSQKLDFWIFGYYVGLAAFTAEAECWPLAFMPDGNQS